MMVKNEEANILKSLRSVESLVDTFYILDTGSEDKTEQYVKTFCEAKKKQLHFFKEEFIDFSTSKNSLLDKCMGESDYIIFLDANDEVHNPSILLEYLNSITTDIHMFATRMLVLNDEGNTYDFMKFAVFKNDALIRYKYPVHEQLISHGGVKDYSLLKTSFYISNDRSYDNSQERHIRDIRIIEDYLTKNESIFMMYELCQTYFNVKDYKNAYRAALRLIRVVDANPMLQYSEYFFQAYMIAGQSLFELKFKNYYTMFLKAFEYSKKYIERCEPLVLLADCFYKQEDYSAAKFYIEMACKLDKPSAEEIKHMIIRHNLYDKRWYLRDKLTK